MVLVLVKPENLDHFAVLRDSGTNLEYFTLSIYLNSYSICLSFVLVPLEKLWCTVNHSWLAMPSIATTERGLKVSLALDE